MKITKSKLKQIIKEELENLIEEDGDNPFGEPYDLSTLVKKNIDPDKKDAAEQAGRDDATQGLDFDPGDKWEGTEYYEFYKEAYEHENERSEEGWM